MDSSSSGPFSQTLVQLCEEISRIAARLSRLGRECAGVHQYEFATTDNVSELSAQTAQFLRRARRLRGRYLPQELFADPAWDMMLELLSSENSHRCVTMSDLCAAIALPSSTTLRWAKALEHQGLLTQEPELSDARTACVKLSPRAKDALHRYFDDLRSDRAANCFRPRQEGHD